jgi:NAD(P)-dependent dehydrogenase (short-subunit alcohol dehydrogenase family)
MNTVTSTHRIFITGSSDGLGQMAARLLIEQGHEVILHARNQARADDARRALPGARACVIGDASSLDQTRSIAEQINALGPCTAVIHNAAVGYQEPARELTVDGLPHVFAINVLSPYVLTALIERPRRLIYLSSGLHHTAGTELDDLLWEKRRWNGTDAYAESKFQDVLLAFAAARRWPDVRSNALEPGWVPTKMGGPTAPDDINLAHLTQAWLAVSDDADALRSGEFYFHRATQPPNPAARDVARQDRLLERCAELSGVTWGV